jgi:hypothetical protein
MHPILPLKKTKSTIVSAALIVLASATSTLNAQSVSEVITDYNGYWKSGVGHINSVKPVNSHNLVSFTYNSVRYSTGVNDALLTTNNQPFTPGMYKALPVSSITGAVNSNTKIGLGEMYDGVHAGASNPAPQNNMVKYLTDGIKGLDLGTCVANLPAGDLFFPVNNFDALSIGDNIPDLVITQIADPSSAADSYEFTDIFGNRVGNKVDINLANLQTVGNWTADFYDNIKNPMTLASGFTNTDRALRLWTSDFSAFGINSSNIGQIAYFKIRLNGNSDVAFVAYNEKAVNLTASVLPVQFGWFRGKAVQQQVELSWQSVSEINNDKFIIEASTDGVKFTTIDSVLSRDIAPYVYTYTDRHAATGKSWYRLKQVDKNGAFSYSQIIAVSIVTGKSEMSLFPNPATSTIQVRQPLGATAGVYQVRNMQGAVLVQQQVAAGTVQQSLNIQSIPAGVYWLVWNDGMSQKTESFVKK